LDSYSLKILGQSRHERRTVKLCSSL